MTVAGWPTRACGIESETSVVTTAPPCFHLSRHRFRHLRRHRRRHRKLHERNKIGEKNARNIVFFKYLTKCLYQFITYN